MGLLIKLIAAFIGLAAAILALQYVPMLGFIAMWLGGPLWIGALFHILLVVILVAAISGHVPRWSMAIPLAVWVGGIVAWQLSLRSALAGAADLKTMSLAAGDGPIVVRGDYFLSQALAAGYTAAVYSDFRRETLVKGSACTPSAVHDPNRTVLLPPYLTARGECVVSEKADPPQNAVEVIVQSAEQRKSATGGTITPIEIRDARNGQSATGTLEVAVEHVLAPAIFPMAGFIYGSQNMERVGVFGLLRIDHPIPSRPSETGDAFGSVHAAVIAEALGLRPR